MEPLAGVEFLQGDFRERRGVRGSSRRALGAAGVDLLLSDMAPNLSGMDAIDAPRGMYLAELALDIGAAGLETGRQRPDQGAAGRRLPGAGGCWRARVSGGQMPETGGVAFSQS